MNRKHIKIAILAVSCVLNSGMMTSAILADVAKAFPGAGEATVQMVLTSIALVAMVCALAAGPLSKKLPIRSLLLFALTVSALGGALGFLFGPKSMAVLFVVSASIGVAQGMCSTLTLVLISGFFDGEQRSGLMGMQSAMVNGGGMIIVFVSGLLAGIVWNAAYLILLSYAVLIVITVKFLPKAPPESAEAVPAEGGKRGYGFRVYYWCFMMFACAVLLYVYFTNVSLFMFERSLGDATTSGMSNTIFLAVGCVTGFTFSYLKRFFKKTLAFTGFLVMGIGLFLAYSLGTLPAVLFAGACCGFCMAVIYPLVFYMVSKLVRPAQMAVAMAVTTSCSNVGMFLSPLIMTPFSSLFSPGDIGTRFIVAAALCVVLAVVGIFGLRGNPSDSYAATSL